MTIQIQKIDSKLHAACMHGFARYDPEACAIGERLPSEQATPALLTLVCERRACGDNRIALEIRNPKSSFRGYAAAASKEQKERFSNDL